MQPAPSGLLSANDPLDAQWCRDDFGRLLNTHGYAFHCTLPEVKEAWIVLINSLIDHLAINHSVAIRFLVRCGTDEQASFSGTRRNGLKTGKREKHRTNPQGRLTNVGLKMTKSLQLAAL